MAKVSGQGRFYRRVPGKNVIINFRYQVAKIIYIVFVRQVGYNMIKECRERWDRSMEKLQDEKLTFYIPVELSQGDRSSLA